MLAKNIKNIPVLMILIFLFGCKDHRRYEVKSFSNGSIKRLNNESAEIEFYKGGVVNFMMLRINENRFIGYKFDSTGNIIEKAFYFEGKRNGKTVEYFSSGKIKGVGNYRNGIPYGKGIEYYESGEIFRHYYYQSGDLIYYKALNTEGIPYDSKLPIKVSPLKDTHILGDSHKFKIELEYTIYDSCGIGVVIGEFNNSHLTDTISKLSSDKQYLIYSHNPGKRGRAKFSGVLFEIDLAEDRIKGSSKFNYEYEVK